jgi:outer membrane protein OmpA-like peptidoglycan-associated protein
VKDIQMTRIARSMTAGGTLCLLLLALACASPPPPSGLVDAKAAYQKAEADPVVQQNGSVELLEAKRALDRAESEWNKEGDAEETEHLAYLAKRRVEIAELWAAGRKAMKDGQDLSEQRALQADKMLSAAEQARADAEAARRAAEEAAAREAKLRAELSELQARETARGLELTLGDILFDVDKATLKPGAMQNLYRLVTFLKEYPDRAVLVEGHTDSTGSDSYNLSLSEQRAGSVRSFLTGNGIQESRVLARGYGKAYPVAGNDTAAGRQRNRRVDVVILHSGESPEGRLRPAAQ